MDLNGSVLEHLSRDECLRLVGQVPVGRIVYTRQALPAVELVNFALDDGDIVIQDGLRRQARRRNPRRGRRLRGGPRG